ncbi:extracellular solute-binding protein [Candidatus Gracilibacteria bacterium]|nr:extracellular solute-binding protein [Candidatus Gracilibacteria bacterium]
MSPKKIIFFVIVGSLLLALILAVVYISKQKKETNTAPDSLKIWITEGTSDSYKSLIEGFKKYAPEYTKTNIVVEKQSSDAERYRTLLLSTLTEGNGPDIFMLHSGEDAILESKTESIPSEILDFTLFDKRYDDIFKELLSSSGSGKNKKTTLKGVPLGYETLGIFYNKSLLRSVPKTWNDLESLYREMNSKVYPSNLGLGPTFTPNMIDILPIWLNEGEVYSYNELGSARNSLGEYLKYGTLPIGNADTNDNNGIGQANSLNNKKTLMREQKLTTLDLFMRGDIALIVGYPSLVLELEKSGKRAGGSSKENVILTDRLPQKSSQSVSNVGRYTYLGISKLTNNAIASVKFLEYLMTPEAQRIYMTEYPYLIPAQSEFYASAESNSLSNILTRTTLSAFIPNIGDKISIFDYGLKSLFERYLREGIDNTDEPDTEALISKISQEVKCQISTLLGETNNSGCSNE